MLAAIRYNISWLKTLINIPSHYSEYIAELAFLAQLVFFSASRRACSSFSFRILAKNFRISSIRMTGMEKAITASHSVWFIAWMEKIYWRKGT